MLDVTVISNIAESVNEQYLFSVIRKSLSSMELALGPELHPSGYYVRTFLGPRLDGRENHEVRFDVGIAIQRVMPFLSSEDNAIY